MARRRLRRENGMVSAELAVAFPAVVLALLAVLGGATYGIAASRAQDAARTAARAAARGDPPGQVVTAAHRAAPGADVGLSADGRLVTARIVLRVGGPVAWMVPGGRVSASAVAVREETDDTGP